MTMAGYGFANECNEGGVQESKHRKTFNASSKKKDEETEKTKRKNIPPANKTELPKMRYFQPFLNSKSYQH